MNKIYFNTIVQGNDMNADDSVTKSTKGYLIEITSANAGVYFIRNNKTGQVLKFVKE